MDDKILIVLNDMMDTLHTIENGVAFVAKQVDILKCFSVIDYYEPILCLLNPIMIDHGGDNISGLCYKNL